MFHRMMNYGELEAKPTLVLTKDVIRAVLPKFKRHDDLIIVQDHAWVEFKNNIGIPVVDNENSPFSIDEDELASLVCQTVQKPVCRRLAIEKRVKNDDYRSPRVKLIIGENGVVRHKENHITYQFDVTKCMFSFGNIKEKLRMATLDCSDEVVVDLFAGIGYFSLPLLVHSKAKHLYACEWNPDAIDALRKNLILNKINPERYTVIEGDNRLHRPTNIAQRILLGILPTCSGFMRTAIECADKSTGATLHCHDLVETKDESEEETNEISDTKVGATMTSSLMSNNSNSSPQVPGSALTATSTIPNYVTDNQSLSNQSFTSVSSHSTIEKISCPFDDLKLQSIDLDKDESNTVSNFDNSSVTRNGNSLCENDGVTDGQNIDMNSKQPSQHTTRDNNLNGEGLSTSCASSINGDEFLELTNGKFKKVLETRAQVLISIIEDDLESHGLVARLLNIQLVKSYAPHVTHVVFDIRLDPKRPSTGSRCSEK